MKSTNTNQSKNEFEQTGLDEQVAILCERLSICQKEIARLESRLLSRYEALLAVQRESTERELRNLRALIKNQ